MRVNQINFTSKYSCTDEDVILWLHDGSPALESKALACLYKRILENLCTWVNSKGGSREDAHDALTEALYVFICRLREEKYEEQGKLENFLFRIAQFKFYDSCKKQNRPISSSLEEIFPGGSIPDLVEKLDEDTASETVVDARLKELNRCFNLISERCKERLERFWYRGESYEETAKAMGDASIDVAKVMKSKCQQKLKKLMKPL